jgi:probable phosphoglycerate mutase
MFTQVESSSSTLRRLRVILVRHGETDFNVSRKLQGQMDIALNDTGHLQARQAAAFLSHHCTHPRHAAAISTDNIIGVVSSDLQRAAKTAHTILDGLNQSGRQLPYLSTTELRERCIGSLEGLTMADMRQHHPAHAQKMSRPWDAPDWVPPGEQAESYRNFHQRCIRGLLNVCRQAVEQFPIATHQLSDVSSHRDHHRDTIIVVTHGAVLGVFMRAAAGVGPADRHDLNIPILNASMHWLVWKRSSAHDLNDDVYREEFEFEHWGDVRHLNECGAVTVRALDEIRNE